MSGVANIEIGILDGSLQREVIINFSTQDESALGQFVCKCIVHKPDFLIYIYIIAGADYIGMANFSVTFNSSNRVNNVHLQIINDLTDEDIETLLARITLLTPPFSSNQTVILAPNTTLVHIYDDDGK